MAYLEYVNAAPDHQDLLATLAKANHFTMEELAQNRAGRIADSQMFKLALKAVRPVFLASRALLGWLLFLLVLRVFVPGFALRMASDREQELARRRVVDAIDLSRLQRFEPLMGTPLQSQSTTA